VVGVSGGLNDPAEWRDVPRVGDVEGIRDAILSTGANGVVIAASALSPDQLKQVTRDLLHRGVHVHVSSGLKGIASQRIRPLPLAHEPFFYLEAIELSPWQFAMKRIIDLAFSALGLLMTAPVFALAALAIKLTDGGPVLFRQERVGRNGRHFTMLKLRTMTPGADRRLAEVALQNERAGGPLFKLARDPRRTRVGHLLELMSLDELPQLWNVLRGDMSLVGPRPALPHEVEQFDDELLIRLSVPPGITGLWQVEARENPAFDAYRRLDLFYVENWSVALDLGILIATFRSLVLRLVGRRERAGLRDEAEIGRAANARPAATRPAS
jgi:exopolysaccharide biosynthesis polyprenyl glycosylphosphotransferase